MIEQQGVHVGHILASLQSRRAFLDNENVVTEAAAEISHCMALHFGCGYTSVEQHCENK